MKKIFLTLIIILCHIANISAQLTIFTPDKIHTITEGRLVFRQNFNSFEVTPNFYSDRIGIPIESIDSIIMSGLSTNPTKIDFKKQCSATEIDNAYNLIKNLAQHAQNSSYALRGGKNGDTPSSHAYQYQFALGTDLYAQYGVLPHSSFPYTGIRMTSTYNIDSKVYGGAMSIFTNLKAPIVSLLNHPVVDSIPELKAIYLLLYNYAAIEVCDIYGPFPYKDYLFDESVHPYQYDDVRNIYHAVVEDINQIVACFKHFQQKPISYQDAMAVILSTHSRLFFESELHDNMNRLADNWRRFANSLKLRLAMHIVKVDPITAQQWAEEAVTDGVIEDETHEVAFRGLELGYTHPLIQINHWNDWRMSASMESMLKSLNHPYIRIDENLGIIDGYLFNKNSNPIVNKKTGEITPANSRIVGIRSGTHIGESQGYSENQYVAFSKLNAENFDNAPLYLMKLSEVCFLRAEGAIRSWNMNGAAKDFYEKGIRHAGFEDRKGKSASYNGTNYYDAMVESYLQQEEAIPYTYIDPTGETADIESVTKIGVKWNENDDLDTKLEKIITQKYIAGFPYSLEAWTDLRRTGYPKLFEVLNANEADGSLKQGDIIRRLYFPDRNNPEVRQDIQETGLKALGGNDWLGTRLWWDIEKGNFK